MLNIRKALLSRGTKRQPLDPSEFTPVEWSKYFMNRQDVIVGDSRFHVYTIGEKGPLLITIHGGGYSALTWSLFAKEITYRIECQLLAIDLRGHGSTATEDDNDLSLETLANDVVNVINILYGENLPPIVLIGHSMGGAVAVVVASRISASGLCVIDVVEGTAMESLSSMQTIIQRRPSSFKSIDQAIQWSINGGYVHNLESARVSMPGQIKNAKTGNLAANETESNITTFCEKSNLLEGAVGRSFYCIDEEREEELKDELEKGDTSRIEDSSEVAEPHNQSSKEDGGQNFKLPDCVNQYVWKVDLSKTEPFWSSWFKGLSQKFLDVPAPKVLILANINGLDTTLTVGQMQGKFQLKILPKSGHAIHEDLPNQVADVIGGFLVKQRIAESRNGFNPSTSYI